MLQQYLAVIRKEQRVAKAHVAVPLVTCLSENKQVLFQTWGQNAGACSLLAEGVLLLRVESHHESFWASEVGTLHEVQGSKVCGDPSHQSHDVCVIRHKLHGKESSPVSAESGEDDEDDDENFLEAPLLV